MEANKRTTFKSPVPVLDPPSIAIVGASERARWPQDIRANLLAAGYKGPIYPINPRLKELWDGPCYPDLASTPKPAAHALADAGVLARDLLVAADDALGHRPRELRLDAGLVVEADGHQEVALVDHVERVAVDRRPGVLARHLHAGLRLAHAGADVDLAVDGDQAAGHEARGVGGQKDDGPGHFLGLCIAAQRRLAAIVFHLFECRKDFVMPCFNDPRHDGIGSNCRGEFPR